jgi:hypothetical protein
MSATFRCTGCGHVTDNDTDNGCYVCDLCEPCTPDKGNCLDCADMRNERNQDFWTRYNLENEVCS